MATQRTHTTSNFWPAAIMRCSSSAAWVRTTSHISTPNIEYRSCAVGIVKSLHVNAPESFCLSELMNARSLHHLLCQPSSSFYAPLEVKHIKGKGRGVVAIRDIAPVELLLASSPLALLRAAPPSRTSPPKDKPSNNALSGECLSLPDSISNHVNDISAYYKSNDDSSTSRSSVSAGGGIASLAPPPPPSTLPPAPAVDAVASSSGPQPKAGDLVRLLANSPLTQRQVDLLEALFNGNTSSQPPSPTSSLSTSSPSALKLSETSLPGCKGEHNDPICNPESAQPHSKSQSPMLVQQLVALAPPREGALEAMLLSTGAIQCKRSGCGNGRSRRNRNTRESAPAGATAAASAAAGVSTIDNLAAAEGAEQTGEIITISLLESHGSGAAAEVDEEGDSRTPLGGSPMQAGVPTGMSFPSLVGAVGLNCYGDPEPDALMDALFRLRATSACTITTATATATATAATSVSDVSSSSATDDNRCYIPPPVTGGKVAAATGESFENATANISSDASAGLESVTEEASGSTGSSRGGFVGLWPDFAMLSHSCCPNTINLVAGPHHHMLVRATEEIRAGQEVTVCYFGRELLAPRYIRVEAAQRTHGFECCCDRCSFEASLGRDLEAALQRLYVAVNQKWGPRLGDLAAQLDQASDALLATTTPSASSPVAGHDASSSRTSSTTAVPGDSFLCRCPSKSPFSPPSAELSVRLSLLPLSTVFRCTVGGLMSSPLAVALGRGLARVRNATRIGYGHQDSKQQQRRLNRGTAAAAESEVLKVMQQLEQLHEVIRQEVEAVERALGSEGWEQRTPANRTTISTAMAVSSADFPSAPASAAAATAVTPMQRWWVRASLYDALELQLATMELMRDALDALLRSRQLGTEVTGGEVVVEAAASQAIARAAGPADIAGALDTAHKRVYRAALACFEVVEAVAPGTQLHIDLAAKVVAARETVGAATAITPTTANTATRSAVTISNIDAAKCSVRQSNHQLRCKASGSSSGRAVSGVLNEWALMWACAAGDSMERTKQQQKHPDRVAAGAPIAAADVLISALEARLGLLSPEERLTLMDEVVLAPR